MNERLATALVLGYPDSIKPYTLDADTGDVDAGAVWSQVQGGGED